MVLKIIFLVSIFSLAVFGQKDNPVVFSDISVDSMGLIKWSTAYLQNGHSLQILVERFVDGNWTEAGGFATTWEINRRIMINKRTDSSKVKFHRGTNKYRLRMTYPSMAASKEFNLTSKVSNDDGSLWISGGQINLDNKEYWEIIGNNAAVIKKGETQIIDISTLNKGSYWLYTPTSTRSFVKD